MNYLTYPFKTMRITQNYLGTTSHYPHTTGNIKDYPIDEAGKDAGRDPFYCPCDELKIVKIYGYKTGGTNTMWVESTTKCDLADGTKDYVCGQLTHMNDSDLSRLKVGQTFKRGEIVCYEGTDGATGNHIHHSWGKGKISEGGWTQNSNGKWVLRTTKGTYKPEKLFFIDKSFTTVDSAAGLAFKNLPTSSKKSNTTTTTTEKATDSFLPSRGYFTKGDVSENVGKIASFMRKTFPSYTKAEALGNTYGPNLIAAVKEFQKRTGLEVDGNFGPKTLAELKKYGFTE